MNASDVHFLEPTLVAWVTLSSFGNEEIMGNTRRFGSGLSNHWNQLEKTRQS